MADRSAAANLGKVVFGGAVGFALYLFVTGLGFGGLGSGAGQGEAPSLPPPRPRDQKRLTFVMQGPEAAGRPMVFRLRDDDPSVKTYALDDMVARIKAGGRSDVNLRVRGGVIQGPADEALALLKRAGIEVWKEDATGATARVSGGGYGPLRAARRGGAAAGRGVYR